MSEDKATPTDLETRVLVLERLLAGLLIEVRELAEQHQRAVQLGRSNAEVLAKLLGRRPPRREAN